MKQLILATLLIAAAAAPLTPSHAENWASWRGPRGDGTCIETEVPTHWDPANAAWKTRIPGIGHSSPIVWGDRIFTATATPETQERILLCVDRSSGAILWQETVVKGPLEKLHKENSYASGTPVTDGQRVFIAYRVDEDIVIAAHDAKTGKQLWIVRPGTHVGEWGFSNSPVLYKDTVILDGDSKGDSFLIALNQTTGETVWRVDRTNKGISYSAPLFVEVNGQTQMIQCGDRRVTGFNPDSGEEIWTVDGPSQEFVATPVFSKTAGLVFVSSSWPKQTIFAIRPDGHGNVTETHVEWSSKNGAPYTPSMIVAGQFLLSVTMRGDAYCFDAKTGTIHWEQKLNRHHASPVLINGLVYLINDDGQIHVIRPAAEFQLVAQYELGESCYASPAISNGQVFIRGFENLYCFKSK